MKFWNEISKVVEQVETQKVKSVFYNGKQLKEKGVLEWISS